MVWIFTLFLVLIFLLTVGVRGMTRITGEVVGNATMLRHKTAELIYHSGRIPRGWVSHLLEKGTSTAEQRARETAKRKMDRLISHFRRSRAFADGHARRELLTALVEARSRVATEPWENLVGPNPRLRRVVVLLDCGDTLADEATEVKDADGVTLRATLIPGAARMVRRLRAAGHALALVADGSRGTFENILKPRRIWRLFDAYAISQEVGVSKPDPRMFEHALSALGVSAAEYPYVVMVGNNLARDVRGANALGLTSIWLNWSPRRSKVPQDELEVPDYTAVKPADVVRIVRRLEAEAGE